MRHSTRSALSGAAEAAAVMLGVLAFGLGWAAAERGAAAAGEPYPWPVEERSSSTSRPASLPPAAIWLIDGYNLLHAGLLPPGERREWWTAPHRERLLAHLDRFCRSQERPVEVWVVFDGDRAVPTGSGDCGAVHTVFAPSADRWLVKRVRSAPEPGKLAVVTGDRQLGDRARHRGAYVVSPRLFLACCSS